MIGAKSSRLRMARAMALAFLASTPTPAQEPKLKPQELVTRHLQTVGSGIARPNPQSRAAQGDGSFEVLIGGSGLITGPAILVSEGPRLRFSVKFGELNYSHEEIAFDGKKCSVGNIAPGIRSQLGQFLYQYDEFVKEGLLGGVLSTAWPLHDLKIRRPRLDYRGIEKLNGRELLELRYRMRKGGRDFTINLYFDPETFRHAATISRLTISAQMGRTTEESARRSETRLKLEEWFDDFRTADGFDLPHRWTIRLTLETEGGNFLGKWDMNFKTFLHDISVNPKIFVLNQD